MKIRGVCAHVAKKRPAINMRSIYKNSNNGIINNGDGKKESWELIMCVYLANIAQIFTYGEIVKHRRLSK